MLTKPTDYKDARQRYYNCKPDSTMETYYLVEWERMIKIMATKIKDIKKLEDLIFECPPKGKSVRYIKERIKDLKNGILPAVDRILIDEKHVDFEAINKAKDLYEKTQSISLDVINPEIVKLYQEWNRLCEVEIEKFIECMNTTMEVKLMDEYEMALRAIIEVCPTESPSVLAANSIILEFYQ